MTSAAVSQSLFSHKLFYSSSSIPSQNCRFNHFSVFACSLNKPFTRIRRKKVKSNDELCNDIREFLTSVGLSQYHVPSTKELSHHGRQDLANIVRRRGYKFIKELLQTSTTEYVGTLQSNELERINEFEGQKEKSESLTDDILPNEAIKEGEIKELQRDLKPIVVTNSLTSESNALTMEEKVTRFMQHGELDTVEDSGFGALYDSYADKTESNVESDNAHEPTLPFNYQPTNDISLRSSNGTESLNLKGPSSSALKVEDPVLSSLSTDEWTSVNPDKDYLYTEVCNKHNMENQDEIKRLKSILHHKEVELAQLKQQIEKEKLALSVLQATAETEISKARKFVTETETELYDAEESLSGLKEVEIQYSGEGETVEVAGSFNGWHQSIPMDPHSYTEPTESPRASQLWKTVLWLYPGVYEIKFVVDGHWRIDPEKELTTRGSFNNNILRVDR